MREHNDFHPQPPADELDWEPVLAWHHEHRKDDPGHWERSTPIGDGSFTAPYAVLSDSAKRFVRLLYKSRIVSGFDWSAWMREEGEGLLDGRDSLEQASLEDCRRLLVAVARGDRFVEGLLLSKLRDGTVGLILDRVDRLSQAVGERQDGEGRG